MSRTSAAADIQVSLLVHGHSCCEVRTMNTSLICDPWLVGSAYWRSWWNFPPQSPLEELIDIWSSLDRVDIYITHLHWDHFHGPTIRRIAKSCKNAHFLIPRTPEKRLGMDLSSIVGSQRIQELVHGRYYQLSEVVKVLSYQSGPFFADSALYIEAGGYTILNANDSKLGYLASTDLMSRGGRPQFILRSHSSANWRACKRNIDGSRYDIPPDKTLDAYSDEFFDFARRFRAQYAIPFASNMAYLHKDTFHHNTVINRSDDVIKSWLRTHNNDYPKPILLLPGESLDLASCDVTKSPLSRDLISRDRNDVLVQYAQLKSTCLVKQYEKERSAVLRRRAVDAYFNYVVSCCPLFVRYVLRDNIYFHIKSEDVSEYLSICFIKRRVLFLQTPPSLSRNDVLFVVHPYVLNDVCTNKHFNSLGVSKRLLVLARPGNPRDAVFNYLCNSCEVDGALSSNLLYNHRFWSVWLRRFPEVIDMIVTVTYLVANKAIKRVIR